MVYPSHGCREDRLEIRIEIRQVSSVDFPHGGAISQQVIQQCVHKLPDLHASLCFPSRCWFFLSLVGPVSGSHP